MKNKIALITGGMGGIGTAICQSLCREGARVIASYHRGGDHQAASQWQEVQRKLGYEIEINYADVSNFDSCGKMTEEIESKVGRIDILVNNAGITRDTQLHKMDLNQWQDVIQTNLNSVFNVTRHVINGMIQRKYGRIVNISSLNAERGQFGQTNYAAAKSGMHGFTKSLAREVARKGITVNIISPGYIETKMLDGLQNENRDKAIAQIPLGRFGKPEEIARAVGFLVAEDSSYITGASLAINGGLF